MSYPLYIMPKIEKLADGDAGTLTVAQEAIQLAQALKKGECIVVADWLAESGRTHFRRNSEVDHYLAMRRVAGRSRRMLVLINPDAK